MTRDEAEKKARELVGCTDATCSDVHCSEQQERIRDALLSVAAEAEKAERERCAGIADECADYWRTVAEKSPDMETRIPRSARRQEAECVARRIRELATRAEEGK